MRESPKKREGYEKEERTERGGRERTNRRLSKKNSNQAKAKPERDVKR